MFLNQIEPPAVKGNVCDWRQCIYCEEYFCSDDMKKHFLPCMEAYEYKQRIEWEIERLKKDGRFVEQTEHLLIYKEVSEDKSNEGNFKFRRHIMFAIFTLLVGLVAGVVGMNHADHHGKNDNQTEVSQKK